MDNPLNFLDITPTPRILRILGEIPFQPWQCLAELIDNSIDAFLQHESTGEETPCARIVINWSNSSVPANLFSLEISDTASGMSLHQIIAVYNGSSGGTRNTVGVLHSEETKRYLSKIRKGKQTSLGRVMSEETRKKIGEKARLRGIPDVCVKAAIADLTFLKS